MYFNCIIYTNATYEDSKALSVNGNIIMTGDNYHNEIDTLIEGFFCGLEYVGCAFSVENISLRVTDELFNECGFIDNGEGDLI